MGGYAFSVTGVGCGCVGMSVIDDNTSVTCSGWTAAGQTCFFDVRTLSPDCQFKSDPATSAITLPGLILKYLQNHIISYLYFLKYQHPLNS